MNIRIKSLPMLLSICLASFLAIATVLTYFKTYIKNKSKSTEPDINDTELLNVLEAEEPLVFLTMEEYQAYLLSLPTNVQMNEEPSTVSVCSQIIPNDVYLTNITVDSTGTTFNYSVDREGNILFYHTSDETIISMVSSLIQKQFVGDFITNYREFAANLADDIGAVPLLSSANSVIYSGPVYADVYIDEIDAMQNILVGTQKIVYTYTPDEEYDGTVMYYYYPATISEREFAAFAQLSDYE